MLDFSANSLDVLCKLVDTFCIHSCKKDTYHLYRSKAEEVGSEEFRLGHLERMLFLIGSICIVAVILVAIVSIFGDADLTTLFYEKYGKDLKKELSGKVVWITGASTGRSVMHAMLHFTKFMMKVSEVQWQ